MKPRDPKIFWTTDEVAAYCKVSKSTVVHWREREYGPRHFGARQHIRYRKADVEQWALTYCGPSQGKSTSEMIRAGIAHARKRGQVFGRPKMGWVDDRVLMALHLSGFSLRAIAAELEISHRTVHCRLKKAPLYQRYQKEIECLKDAKQGLTQIRRWLQMKIQEA